MIHCLESARNREKSARPPVLDEELLNCLTNARNTDELHDAKCSVLRDFHDVYAFDVGDAEFPEPVGHFDDEEEKNKFIWKKILLQDTVLYLGSVYKKYHYIIYQTHNRLPEIELKKLAIDYNEIYRKAMEDYIAALVTGEQHAVTASFGALGARPLVLGGKKLCKAGNLGIMRIECVLNNILVPDPVRSSPALA